MTTEGAAAVSRLARWIASPRRATVIIVLLAAVLGALRGAAMRQVPGDFLRYHRAGRLVATGRADLIYDAAFLRRQEVYAAERTKGGDPLFEEEFKYGPATAVLMAPLGALPVRPANAIWSAWNAGLIAWMFVACWQLCGASVSAWFVLVPIVVCLRLIGSNVSLGQINPCAIVPATLGMVWLARRRDTAAGVAIGLGTVVKYMPGLLAVWLIAKRRWRALFACIATVVLLGAVLPAVVLGPGRSVDLAGQWLHARTHVYTDAAAADVPGYSVKSFVYRVVGDVPYVTFSNTSGRPLVIGWGLLGPSGLRTLALAIDVALLAWVLWRTRGPLRDERDPRGALEAAAMLALLPLVSPEARLPHFLFLALPLTAITCALVRGDIAPRRRSAVIVLSLLAVALLHATWPKLLGERGGLLAEAWCAPGAGALALLAAVLVAIRAPQRDAPPGPSAESTT